MSRYVKNCQCCEKEFHAARSNARFCSQGCAVKAYYLSNKEHILTYHKDYRETNKLPIASYRKQYYQDNREAFTVKAKENYTNNKVKVREQNLVNKYGITLAQWEAFYAQQDGKCAICERPFKGARDTNVDHCHTMGKVRGLLCSQCNVGLGSFNDNPDVLIKASQYIKHHGEE